MGSKRSKTITLKGREKMTQLSGTVLQRYVILSLVLYYSKYSSAFVHKDRAGKLNQACLNFTCLWLPLASWSVSIDTVGHLLMIIKSSYDLFYFLPQRLHGDINRLLKHLLIGFDHYSQYLKCLSGISILYILLTKTLLGTTPPLLNHPMENCPMLSFPIVCICKT